MLLKQCSAYAEQIINYISPAFPLFLSGAKSCPSDDLALGLLMLQMTGNNTLKLCYDSRLGATGEGENDAGFSLPSLRLPLSNISFVKHNNPLFVWGELWNNSTGTFFCRKHHMINLVGCYFFFLWLLPALERILLNILRLALFCNCYDLTFFSAGLNT